MFYNIKCLLSIAALGFW